MKSKVINYDALIIGGGQSGIITANLLSNLGYKTLLIEKKSTLGGGNGSFQNSFGDFFDYGYHALDYNRSVFTTNFFKSVLDDKVNIFNLKRGILLKNNIIKYAEHPKKWPKKLNATPVKAKDNLNGSKPITRTMLYEIYGDKFTNYIYDETINSYPSLKKLRDLGYNEEELVQKVYPWFFPNVKKTKKANTEFQIYHDKVRNAGEQKIMYPKAGYFYKFMEEIINKCNHKYLTIKTDVKDMQFNMKNNKLSSIKIEDTVINPKLVYWCTSLSHLSSMLNIPIKKSEAVKQKIVLGSFTFQDNLNPKFHEILVGDPNYNFNRIGFPKKLAKLKKVNTVQVEYYFPSDQYDYSEQKWKKLWLEQLKKSGLVKKENKLLEFDLKSYDAGYLISKVNNDHLKKLNEILNKKSSNIIVPFKGEGPENINRIVPTVYKNVIDEITKIKKG